ncbi:MAG: tetratricopeptide repeat protein [Anaeromyxobacter sp.]
MGSFAREACAAVLLLAGCAGPAGAGARDESASLRSEVQALRHENEALAARLEELSGRVDILTARLTRGQPEPRAAAAPAAGAQAAPAADAPVIPPHLAVVKVAPPAGGKRKQARAAPAVPTTVAMAEPDLSRLGGGAAPRGPGVSAQAEAELTAARGQGGLDRAHALEDFTKRYPRHPAADNALLEAAAAYQEADRDDAACTLARRVADEYPAGDALPDALERQARCAAARGDGTGEARLLKRLTTDYPDSPAATRAGARLSTISGSDGEDSPRDVPARSVP